MRCCELCCGNVRCERVHRHARVVQEWAWAGLVYGPSVLSSTTENKIYGPLYNELILMPWS